MKPKSSFLTLATLSLTLLAVAGCGSEKGADTTTAAGSSTAKSTPANVVSSLSTKERSVLAPLYEQATQGGKVVVNVYSAYASPDPDGGLTPIWTALERAFPKIDVRDSLQWGPGLLSRVDGESASGKHQGDIVISGVGDLEELRDKHRFVSYRPTLSDGLRDTLRAPNDAYAVPFLSLFGLTYNTNVVKPQDVPKTLTELLSGKWKGRIGINKPIGQQPIDFALAQLLYNKRITADQIKRVAEQAKILSAESTLSPEVAQGRVAFGLWGPAQVAATAKAKGAPLAIAPFDSQVLNGPGAGLLADGPHAAAAKLVLNYLYTKEAQALFASRTNNYSVIPGAAPPPGFPPIDEKELAEVPTEKFAAALATLAPITTSAFGAP